MLAFLPTSLDKVISEINAWFSDRTPSEVIYIVFASPPDSQPVVMLQLVYTGDPEIGQQKFERFKKLGPVMDQTTVIPYIQLNHLNDRFSGHGMYRMLHGSFVPEVPEGLPITLVNDLFNSWAKFIKDNPAASFSVIALELHHHGKISSVPADATAYIHRHPSHAIMSLITWMDPGFNEHATQATLELNQAINKTREEHFPSESLIRGGYINYMDEDSRTYNKEFTHGRFGANYPRLMELKSKYDPARVFGRWLIAPQVTSGENNW
ncbi:unnamed protein product [Rhizoctonia solani]|uniref:Berberine/berberine-like domain-containing protein n=1 Tax=Rhizoctonia solani TaxID=456999 RepID=A0A8H3H2S7_9AGAM|nr:unnamed protein product [Rhizoctonia solani]